MPKQIMQLQLDVTVIVSITEGASIGRILGSFSASVSPPPPLSLYCGDVLWVPSWQSSSNVARSALIFKLMQISFGAIRPCIVLPTEALAVHACRAHI